MKNTKLQNLGIAVASVLVCFSLGAGAARAGDDRHDDNDKDGKFLLISFQENVTSFDGVNGTLDGKATFAGAFNDRCTRHENFHVVSADKNGNPNIAGTSTFFGTNGTLTTSFTGTIYFSIAKSLSLITSLYFTVVTLSTVGYGDINLQNDPAHVKLVGASLTRRSGP